MSNQFLIAGIVSLTAIISYLNYRYIKLPKTIGVTIITFCLALSLMILANIGVSGTQPIIGFLSGVDFNQTVLHGMIGYILFASSLNINKVELNQYKWFIGCLATISVLISSILIGVATWCLLQIFYIQISIFYCMAFGALISPTDPIAVLSSLKKIQQGDDLKIKFSGEALFNDGFGIVLFLVFYKLGLSHDESFSAVHVLNYFLQGALGGILAGLVLGYFGLWVLKSIKDFHEIFLFTIALVTGGYVITDGILEVSGILAIAICGLIIGSKLNEIIQKESTKQAFQDVWEVIEELLNTILFVLIGLECLTIHFSHHVLLACFGIIGVVLGARTLSLFIPVCCVPKFRRENNFQEIWMLSWGGLRGGVSIALALSLQIDEASRDVIIALTYGVVLFSLVVQGLTIEPLMKRFRL